MALYRQRPQRDSPSPALLELLGFRGGQHGFPLLRPIGSGRLRRHATRTLFVGRVQLLNGVGDGRGVRGLGVAVVQGRRVTARLQVDTVLRACP
jgi:hypothetical protein